MSDVELMPSDVGGAPTKYTPLVVNKLEAAFNNGFNISEACQYAGISRETYYNWLDIQDGFSDKMAQAQSAPNRKAKEVVITAINDGDANLAFRYLQARDPDFKPKFEGELAHGMQETRNKIKEFLDDGSDINTGADATSAEPVATDTSSTGSEVAQTPTDIS